MKKAFATAMIGLSLLISSTSPFAATKADFSYKGATTKDVYEGAGELSYKNHLLYKGTFHKSLYDGQGSLYYPDRTEGVTKDVGQTQNINKIQYSGDFKEGAYYGQGTLYYEVYTPAANHPDFKGIHYQGKFRYDKFSGYGIEYGEEGNIKHQGYFFEGEPIDYEGDKDQQGLMDGHGVLKNSDGVTIYKGSFKHGAMAGEGTLTEPSKSWVYKGHFKQDEFDGQGEILNNNKVYYEGSFVNGFKEGQGTLFNDKGETLYKGLFHNDKPASIPFNVQAILKVGKNLKPEYSLSVLLSNTSKTSSTQKEMEKLKNEVSKKYGSVKDISNSDSQGFTVTTTINDIEKGFTDDFSGISVHFVKTKQLFYNQYDSYLNTNNAYDPNLVNLHVSYEVASSFKNVKSSTKINKIQDFDVIDWTQADGEQMVNVQFHAFNLLNLVIFILFIIVLIGGILYFRKTSKKKKEKGKRIEK